ncbi:MAG: exodeoxyribonuclease V subunit beta [Bermanella sp.]
MSENLQGDLVTTEAVEIAPSIVAPLIVDRVPLQGVRLIEASAGTGKTYTITSLYVRLVLGHDCLPLSPEQILVVTFTRAATEELRDRIRKRLKQAHDALKGDISSDSLIETIIDDIGDVSKAKQRLKDAMQIMDMAAIYTIHGFSQRLLRQNAIESSVSDDFELSMDEASFIQRAVRDVWRSHVYPKQGKALTLLLQNWQTPDDLQNKVVPFIHKNVDFHVGPIGRDYEEVSEGFEKIHKRFSEKWIACGDEFFSAIQANPKASGSFTRWLDGRKAIINKFVENPAAINSKEANTFNYFTVEGLKKSVKKGGVACDHEIVAIFDAWVTTYQQFEESRTYASHQLLIMLIEQIRITLKKLKSAQSVLAPDDLLTLLNQAIEGESGELLLAQIRQQYPVAMVDEFQDTDALQYRVFSAIYQGVNFNKELIDSIPTPTSVSDLNHLAMFMIGDPKQAIYKFRGADIFTYISAKRAVDGAYSLDTNYRSTTEMVAATNQFFTRHKRPFIYDEDIPFVEVLAKGDAKSLYINDKKEAALTWMLADGLGVSSKQELSNSCAEGAAEQICQLLNLAQTGQATLCKAPSKDEILKEEGAPLKAQLLKAQLLKAQDIAVLVRSAKQAKWVKTALSKRGVGSVYVGRESIFQSDQAMAMYSLLQAIHVLSESQFRNAIAHPIWQVSLQTLQEFMQDEALWEAQLSQLYEAREIWLKKGVMAMFMYWLHQRDLPATWLSSIGEEENGERCLTNYLHLAEILQDASCEVQGMQGLISWLSNKISVNIGSEDQQMLRLESDANLVQIVTIHKSKGLEYPVVFLPFSWDGKESSDPLFYDEKKNQLRCDLVGDFKEQRITEGLAEEARLLYVALTRAASKCYVAMPKNVDNKKLSKTLQASALYHVLANGEVDGLVSTLSDQAKLDKFTHIYSMMAMPEEQSYLQITEIEQAQSVREFSGSIKQNWIMSSFSSLIRHVHVPMSARLNQDEDADNNADEKEVEQELAGAFAFPRGAHAGNFLHTLLEEIDFSCLPDDLDQLITDLLVRFSIETHWLDVVKDWLCDILQAPLLHDGLSLQKLTPSKKLVEMEFYFPVSRLNCHDFNRLLAQYPCLNVVTASTDFYQLKGMLKGFIDLTFEWQGQYFILDYKSNFLGTEHSAYDQLATHVAMSEHRYDVQMVIYTLALHRLLKLRIADYDYDRHIGGGYYLFLRGLSASDQQNHYGQYFHKPSRELIESLDDLIKEEVDINSLLEKGERA